MGQVLESFVSGISDVNYRIEVYDTQYSGSVNTVNAHKFELSYMPETDNVMHTIAPSECTIYFMNEIGGYIRQNFIPSLDGWQQTRFQVKIYRDSGSGYELYWFGLIVQDVSVQIEASENHVFALACSDGLALLSDSFYSLNNRITAAPQRSFLHLMLLDILELNRLRDIFTDDENFLSTSINFWEDSQTYAADGDPLTSLSLDNRVFQTLDDNDNGNIYSTGYDALKQICKSFTARIYQAGGVYRFEQFREYTGTTRKEIVYDREGTEQSANSAVSRERNIGVSSLDAGKIANNEFTYLPAFKRAQIQYNQYILSEKAGKYNTNSLTGSEQSIGYVASGTDQGITVTTNYSVRSRGGVDRFRKVKAVFDVIIKLESNPNQPNSVDYYWSSKNDGEWLSSTSSFLIDSNQSKPSSQFSQPLRTFSDSDTFTITTGAFPANGDLSIQINISFQQLSRGDVWVSVTPDETFINTESYLTITEGNGDSQEQYIYAAENTTLQVGDDLIYDLGETNIGDGLVQTGLLYYDDGTNDPESTDEWRYGNSGSYTNIIQLSMNEYLALLSTPTEVYDGAVMYNEPYNYRIVFGMKGYMPLNVTFDSRSGTYSGRWVAYAYDGTNVAAETRLERRVRLFTRTRENANETDLPDGRIGGVEVKKRSGQIEETIELDGEPAGINAGLTETLIAAESGWYKALTAVMIKKTGGSTPYTASSATLRYDGYTQDIVSPSLLLDAINNGKTVTLQVNDGIELISGTDVQLTISAGGSGDYEFKIIPFFRSLEDSADPRPDMVPPLATAATAITVTTFSANWESVEGAAGYKLDVATDAAFTSFVSGYNDLDVSNVTTYSVTTLSSSTEYFYRVRAYNDVEESTSSNVIELETLPNFFVSTWNTANSGVSANDEIALPLVDYGTYNFDVIYDGNTIKTITDYTDNVIEFSDGSGVKQIQITGTIEGWAFANGGDKLKITEISNWGEIVFVENDAQEFQGCSNLDVTATDAPDISAKNSLFAFFRNCTSLTAFGQGWSTGSIVTFERMFSGCSAFDDSEVVNLNVSAATSLRNMFTSSAINQDLTGWNTANVENWDGFLSACTSYNQPINVLSFTSATNMRDMLNGCTTFNQPFTGMATGSVTNMQGMLEGATAFNQALTGLNTSSVTNFQRFLKDASSFDQNCGVLDISSATDMSQFLFNVGISTANYDSTLIAFEGTPPNLNVTFDGGSSTYTLGGAAETARTSLVNTYLWTITDGGGI